MLESTGFKTEEVFHVNALSTLGWYLNGNVLKRRAVPGMQARIADRLVPLFRLERKLNLPFGLSVITVAHRLAASARPGELSHASGDR